MSSEIEVVEEGAEVQEVSGLQETSSSANGVAEENLKNDVYTAAAYGDLEKLQRLVESEGASVSEPDGLGYYALQWAALNNRAAAAQYIIEHGGDVNAVDHTGQTALHWSAVRGAIQVAELLLQEGGRINATDIHGYQTTHVAAQYGQTAFLYHIVSKWNADPDVPDFDGRSPLHWAAYKGFADCIRLLLFLDAFRGRQDKEGCTPLHWAAIRGNLEACTVLVQAGKKEDLVVTDNTGLTPAQLASDKNHRQVAFFLGNARRLLDKRWDPNSRLGRLAKLGLAPFLWCTILLLLVTYIHSVIIASNLPRVTARFGLLAWLGVFLATSGLVMFYRCSRKDPGYIMMNGSDLQNIKDDEPLLKIEMNNPALLAGNWSQLCATCRAASSVTNNGKLSGRSMDYDGENSDDPHADEQHFNDEVQTDYGQENVGEVDDLSQYEAAAEASWEKEGKSENHQYSSKQDSLVESVLTLQSVQRALQSEVQKMREVGKFNNVPADSSLFGSKIDELRSSEQFHSENITQSSSLKSQVLVLTENVQGLENSLREANAMLKVKESRVAYLEAALSTSSVEGSANAPDFPQGQLKRIETEFEELLKEKIEAEVLYLALTRTVEELRVVGGDQLNLFEQQEALAGQQAQMLGKLAKAQSKAARLDERAVELVKYSEDILETEDVLNMQGRVCKATTCFFIQLILLALIFWLLVLQLSSHRRVVVPT